MYKVVQAVTELFATTTSNDCQKDINRKQQHHDDVSYVSLASPPFSLKLQSHSYLSSLYSLFMHLCVQYSWVSEGYSELHRSAPLFKDVWVPSPASSGPHKGLQSVHWELNDAGGTLEVCVCSFSPILVFTYDYMSMPVWDCVCVCPDFVLWKVCQAVSWERRKTRTEAVDVLELERIQREKENMQLYRMGDAEKWRLQKNCGADVWCGFVWSQFHMFVHSKYPKHDKNKQD